MKIALISDIHVHNWQEFSEPGERGPTRLLDCVQTLRDVRDHCVDHGVGVVVIGGDLFHKRGVLYTQAYNLVVEELAQMKRDSVTVFMVDGNHDHADKAGRVHAVSALASAGLVQSIDIAYGFENWHISSDDDSDTLVITGMSYCDGRDRFEQRLEAAGKEYAEEYDGEPRIFVFHHGFKDARVGTALEYQVKEEIDSTVLKTHAFDYAFSGHYHTRQRIGALANGTYIGSPLEHMRGDGGTHKGFMVYDSNTKRADVVKLDRPRFVKLTQAQVDDKDYGIVQGNFVDVQLEDMPKKPDSLLAAIRKAGARGVKLVPVRKTKASPTATRLAIDLTMDTKTVLETYVDHTKPDLDRAEVLRVGQALIDQANA